MKTQLYKYDGTPLFEVIIDDTSTQDWSLMSDNKLSVSFELEECVVLTAGCYIDFDGTRFYLLNEYKPTMICSSVWKYDLTLGDAASWLSITLALKTIDGENTPLFKYTAPAAEHAAIIVANLNRRMDTDQWKVGSVISTENIAIDYSGKYCSDVLQEIVDAKNTEWWIDGMTLNIGRAEFGESVTLGYMNGVLGDIVCDTAGDMRSYAYLFPIGSTRNIDPTKYGHDRLQLPSGLKSVPINPEQGVAELVEEAAFAHIYPRYEGTVSAVRYTTAKNEDGTSFLIYYIKDTAIPFNPNEFGIPGLVKHITFQSGELMGQEFEVNYSADSNEFELITRWTGDIQLPGGVLVPAVGDKYVVWNISMPDVYYTIASHELLDAARAYAADAIKDVSVYKVKLDYIDVQERGLKLRPGQRVRLLSNEYFASGHYDSRITRITRNIAYPDELSVDISAVRVVGTLSKLQASIQKTENVVAQFSGQLPAIIKSNDDTSANDSSVYTSAKSEKEFLNKRKGGRVAAPVIFDEVTEFLEGLVAHKYIKIGNGYLRYNDELGVWEMVGDLLVTGAVTMFGSLSGFKPSTIMDAVQVDGKTIVKNAAGQLQVLGGGGGTGGGLTAAEVNLLIEKALKPYALATSIPTDNKQLSNGAGYTTISDISSALVGYATQSWVGDNYLAKNGGAIEGVLELNSTNAARSIRFNTTSGSSWLFVNSGEWYVTNIGWGAEYNLIHSGNIGQQSVNRAASAGAADSANIATRFESVSLGITDLNEYKNTGAYNFYSSVNAPNSYISNMLVLRYSPDWGSQIVFDSEKNIFVRNWRDSGGVFDTNWRTVAFTDSNVASATKLATPRTIWGQGFDGTQDLNKSLIIGNTQSSLLAAWQEYIGICATGTGLSGWVAEFGNGTKGILLGCRGNNYDIPSIGTVSATDIAIAPDGGNVVIGGTETGSCKLRIATTRSDTFSWVLGDLASKSDFALEFNYNDVYRYGLYSAINYFSGDVGLQVGRSDGETTVYNLVLNPLGGNIAIGGTTADAKLHVHGNSRYEGYLYTKDSFVNTLARDYSGPWARGVEWIGIGDTINASIAAYSNNSIIEYINITANGDFSNLGIRIYNSGLITLGGDTTINGNLLTTGVITTPQISIDGLAAYKLQDDTLFIDANVVVRGAISMFGVNTLTEMESIEQRLLSLEQRVEQLSA